jgi:hypothetical protein
MFVMLDWLYEDVAGEGDCKFSHKKPAVERKIMASSKVTSC